MDRAFCDQLAARLSPWSYDYNVGGASGFTRGGNGVIAAYNAVVYRTPKLAGFTAEVMVAAGEGGAAIVNAPAGRVGRNEGANLQYSAGPLWAGLGYEYFLSKRTSAHADVGTAKTEGVSRTSGVEAGIKHIF